MALEPFKTSESLTMGVELELQLVNPTDFDLAAAASDMLHLLGRKPFPGDVKPEITESMIEIATDVHTRHNELLAQLRRMRDALLAAGDRLNVGVCGGGTHPFQRWFDQRIFAKPRFKEISQLYGYLAKQFTVFGQHVHIGCRSADEGLYLLHALNRYLPHRPGPMKTPDGRVVGVWPAPLARGRDPRENGRPRHAIEKTSHGGFQRGARVGAGASRY